MRTHPVDEDVFGQAGVWVHHLAVGVHDLGTAELIYQVTDTPLYNKHMLQCITVLTLFCSIIKKFMTALNSHM